MIEVDSRGNPESCFGLSQRQRHIAAGVVEALAAHGARCPGFATNASPRDSAVASPVSDGPKRRVLRPGKPGSRWVNSVSPRIRAGQRGEPSSFHTSAGRSEIRRDRPCAGGAARPSRGWRSRRSTARPRRTHAQPAGGPSRRTVAGFPSRSARVRSDGPLRCRPSGNGGPARGSARSLPCWNISHSRTGMRAARSPRPELAGLLAEIDQDRARLEHADGFAAGSVRVDDRRDLAVRTDLPGIRDRTGRPCGGRRS